jgi:hypothetical protein
MLDAPTKSTAPLGGGFWRSLASKAATSFSQRAKGLVVGVVGAVWADENAGPTTQQHSAIAIQEKRMYDPPRRVNNDAD